MSGGEDALGTIFESVLSDAGEAASGVGDAIDEGLKSVGDSFDSLLGSQADGGSAALDAAEGGSDSTLGAGRPDWAGPGGAPSEGFQDPASANAAAPGDAAVGAPSAAGGNAGSGGAGIPGGAGPEAGGAIQPGGPKPNGLLADALGNRGFVERNGNLIGGVVGGLGGGLSAMAKGEQEVKLARERAAINAKNYGGGTAAGTPGSGVAMASGITNKNGLLFNPAGQATAPVGTSVAPGPGQPATSVVQGPARIERFDTNFNGEWKLDPKSGQVVWMSPDNSGMAA